MSLAGIGNAAAGAALVEVIKGAFTNNEDKTATKADIKYLADKLKRFHRVLNMLPKLPVRFKTPFPGRYLARIKITLSYGGPVSGISHGR